VKVSLAFPPEGMDSFERSIGMQLRDMANRPFRTLALRGAAGVENVVLDLSLNGGGDADAAAEAFFTETNTDGSGAEDTAQAAGQKENNGEDGEDNPDGTEIDAGE